MLEHQFFPTPSEVVEVMVAPIWERFDEQRKARLSSSGEGHFSWTVPGSGRKVTPNRWLDPQGGNGAILDYVQERLDHYRKMNRGPFHRKDSHYLHDRSLIIPGSVYGFTCEIDPDLRAVLAEKNYRVIGTDWLEYSEPMTFDVILSNPPFANGVDHALHSWQFMAPGGFMAVLLNAETLLNPYSDKRQLLIKKLATAWNVDHTRSDVLEAIEQAGGLRWLGQCFKGSERTTDVDVVCIYVFAPDIDQEALPGWDKANFEKASHNYSLDGIGSPLEKRNEIKALVARYQATVNTLQRTMAGQLQLAQLLSFTDCHALNKTLGIEDLAKGVRGMTRKEIREAIANSYDATLVRNLDYVRAAFWDYVIRKSSIADRMGSNVQKDFQDFVLRQSDVDFTERNIVEMLVNMMASRDAAMRQLIVETFDKMVGYHLGNTRHTEGWVTNAPGKFKDNKLIFPNGVRVNQWGRIDPWDRTFFDDFDKSMCYLFGKSMDDEDMVTVNKVIQNSEPGQACESTFVWKLRPYKKGTLHFYLTPEIATEFAIAASSNRRWLSEQDPANTRYHRKPYDHDPRPEPTVEGYAKDLFRKALPGS